MNLKILASIEGWMSIPVFFYTYNNSRDTIDYLSRDYPLQNDVFYCSDKDYGGLYVLSSANRYRSSYSPTIMSLDENGCNAFNPLRPRIINYRLYQEI